VSWSEVASSQVELG